MHSNELVNTFIKNDDIDWEQVDVGVKRKIMAHDERLMLVKVKFDEGGVGMVHKHHHSQITHVESGVFEVEIDGAKQTLTAGDGFYIPPNILHGAVCIEEGILIDVFSPMREDFI
ncbi:MAG: cupin domain-containing protein [Ferruginibacter sp.]